MVALKWLLAILGLGLFGSAGALVVYDIYIASQLRRLLSRGISEEGGAVTETEPARRPLGPVRWRLALQWAAGGALALLLGQAVVVVPDGSAGVRVSQIWGVRPGTLSPGVHLVTPLIDSVATYDTREQVFTTAAAPATKNESEVLIVQAREGLNIGLAVAVRYRLDASKLAAIHANLPQPVDAQVVAPVVTTIYRQLAPNYMTREIFATKREELRATAARLITERLAGDGIIVREVLLRDLRLPEEYAKGLEGLLLKEQENERLGTEQEIKAESDAMQYTLPLKQKQIEQTKLEAQARKEATLQNADAAAQAKVIDSKAEIERQKNLAEAEANRIRVTADAEANRIRVTAAADAERLKFEAAVLKQNPMLIQKIIAERLSDKLQIIMVPTDGKNFFASDVLRSAFSGGSAGGSQDDADPDGAPAASLSATRKHRP